MADVIATHPQLARRGLNKIISAYRDSDTKYFKELGATTIPTTEQFYRMIEEGDFGLVPVINEDTGIPIDSFALINQRDFYWVKRALGYAASSEAVESDQYGVMKNRAMKMARAFNKTEEIVAANAYNNSFTTQLAIDGLAWCSTAHTLDTGTCSNRGVTISGTPTDVALSYTGVAQMIAEFMLFKSHRGIIDPRPGPYKLITGPAQGWIADTIIKSNQRAGTTDNDTNVVRADLVSNVAVNPFLSSATAWWLKAPNREDEPGLFRLNFRSMRSYAKYIERLDRFEYYANEVYAYHTASWRGIIGTTG